MLLLTNLHNEMRSRAVGFRALADIIGIDHDRMRKLEYPTKHKLEPWLDETVALANALGVGSAAALYPSGHLTPSTIGRDLPTDMEAIRSGFRIPLNLAVRVVQRLGIADPGVLLQRPVDVEVWAWTLGHSEGVCPVCSLTGGAHRDECVGDLLYGPRSPDRAPSLRAAPMPMRKGRQEGTELAKGLKPLRELMQLTQREMATRLGTDPNTLAILERCERPLTVGMAKRFSQASGIPRERFYVEPVA
jgi:hypothetical protein